jgi:hypothetical protein
MARAMILAVTLAVALVACATGASPATPQLTAGPTRYAGWPPEAQFELIPVVVSSELAVGPNRLLLNLIDQQNRSLVSADRSLELRLYDLATDAAQPVATTQAVYLPIVEGRGLYRAQADFDTAGEWGVEAIASESDGSQRTGRTIFSVRPTASTPAIGAAAPASHTPTASTAAEIAAISTDSQPDPDFYRLSIDQALETGKPFLVIFATPAFCSSQTCGPALDIVKSVAPEFKDRVAFIHVEPYELKSVDGKLEPVLSEQNFPLSVDATNEWGLPTEPYIFVVDSAGKVSAKLEGVASADEIEEALEKVGS